MTQTNSNKSSGSIKKKPRGFAALKLKDPDRFYEIVQQGGWAVQKKGTGHLWTEEEQKAAIEKSRTARKERKLVRENRDRSDSNESN